MLASAPFQGSAAGTAVVQLGTNFSVLAQDLVFSYTARADFVLETDGDYGSYVNNAGTSRGTTFTDRGDWLDDVSGLPGDSGDFEIFVTETSGTVSGGDPLDTWIDITGEQNWYVSYSGSNPAGKQATIDITVREKANNSNTDTVSVTLIARGPF